jgi:hypothetical protein
MLLSLLMPVFLLLKQAVVQPLQVTQLTSHCEENERSVRREDRKGITDLRAVCLRQAIYKRHREYKDENRANSTSK